MRKLLLVLLLSVPIFSIAQEYSDVVQVEEKTADELYFSSREWMAIVFNSANDVIQLEDPENKKLIAKGVKVIDHTANGVSVPLTMYFTLNLEFKDERFRYQISPTKFDSSGDVEYSYELLKDVTTEEGLISYYKSRGIKPWVIGKKQIAKNLEYNKQLFDNVNAALQEIPNDLENELKKEDDNDW